MRVDLFAEGLVCPFAHQMVERVVVKRPTISAKPQPAARLGVAEQRAIVVNIAIDARHAPAWQDGEVKTTGLGLLRWNVEAPCRAILDQGPANLQTRTIGEAEGVG